jgi:hypothetical protein
MKKAKGKAAAMDKHPKSAVFFFSHSIKLQSFLTEIRASLNKKRQLKAGVVNPVFSFWDLSARSMAMN